MEYYCCGKINMVVASEERYVVGAMDSQYIYKGRRRYMDTHTHPRLQIVLEATQ